MTRTINATRLRGPSSSQITIGNLELYISYETCIAVRINGKLYVSENIWGPTTGRHITAIPGSPPKKDRMPRPAFEDLLTDLLDKVNAINL